MRLIYFIPVTFFVISCALTDIKITEKYVPKNLKTINDPVKVFLDVDNVESSKVGVKKGGYGNETAGVYLDMNKSDWVKKSLSLEMIAYGFDVVEKPQKDSIILNVKINQIFIEPDVSFWGADLVSIADLTVTASVPQKGTFRRTFVEYDGSSEMVWTDGDYKERFSGATRNVFSDITKRVFELTKI